MANTGNHHTKPSEDKESEGQFWADQVAKQIITREKFHYLDKPVKKQGEYVVKSGASLSGVLHIGRLSDTIRSDVIATALKEMGMKAKHVWVADSMDPLRKVPAGVPDDYEKYLGMPVTDIPDPEGSYPSYADRFLDDYMKVIDQFVVNPIEKFSMRAEYKKGTFAPFIKKIMAHAEEVREIHNKYRTHPHKRGWSPWNPVCENCGKLMTAKVTEIADGKVLYKCQDYDFESTTAKGCGHKGENDPAKGNGKMVWKAEWASQWAVWNVSCEGAGKEYQVPNSAYWINGEIAEHVLDFPMPVAFFYEHLFIDGTKMSASLGNVVYPKDWLEVASPELLRLLYNKRLMTTRSFSWKDLPALYAEYDQLLRIQNGSVNLTNEKEKAQARRLLELSTMGPFVAPLDLSFSHAAMIAQIFGDEEGKAIQSLKKSGHWKEQNKDHTLAILSKARIWLSKYAPEEDKYVVQEKVPSGISLSTEQKNALHDLADVLESKDWEEKELFNEFYAICQKHGIKNTQFFQAAYRVLLNKERGPKLAPFL
ncbi:MAG TPA: lysine--tRNA ligase, partial [Candidatus Nanoarchaeia archaeon]|nr:lysine--tRNA ligase [Candidatus Nanoarchaeia archaeon]